MQPDLGEGTSGRVYERHRRTVVTMLLLIGLVVLAAWYAWSSVTDSDDDALGAATAPTCIPTAPADAPPPAEIRLNVYNATDRNGLASATAGEMRKRGFAILDVANDPLDQVVATTAEVRANPANEAAATLVMAHVPGAVFVPDSRSDGTIDLVVGAAFEALAPPAGAAPAPSAVGTTTPLPPC